MTGIEELQAVLRSHGLEFETVPAAKELLRAVADDLDSPDWFLSFYAELGPAENSTIPWVVERLSVETLAQLPEAQMGYRWIGADKAPSPIWPANWIVVASVFGDPFFVDTTIESGPVFFARHGAGEWQRSEVASSMEAFMRCLARFETVLVGAFDLDVWDDDGLRADFVTAVRQGLADVLDAHQIDAFAALLN